MQINIPKLAGQYDDWSERELVLLSLLYYFYTTDYKRDTVYYMVASDAKRILDITAATSPGLYLDKLRRVMRIGLLSWDDWSFQHKTSPEGLGKNGHLLSTTATIEDVESIALFCYLAGRMTDPNVIQPHTRLQGIKAGLSITAPLMGSHFSKSLLKQE